MARNAGPVDRDDPPVGIVQTAQRKNVKNKGGTP
jgi:hypothetical protein